VTRLNWDNKSDRVADPDDDFGLDGNSEVVENDISTWSCGPPRSHGQVGQEVGEDEVS
jgi:hypothetical protein